jgi:prephenate dehydrogenase
MSRFAVAGLGLIGGSLALALGARGWDRDSEARRRARERGINAAESLAEALADADVVFIAVSTAQTPALLSEATAARPEALFSDCASLKIPVARAAEALPPGVRFVGGHSMAGSRTGGLAGAEAGLFRGRPWALVPTARSDEDAVSRLSDLVASIGAVPFVLDAERHDEAMTRVSHLPHAVSAALAAAAGRNVSPDAVRLAGPGLLDTTRLARAPLDLLLELALADPPALANAIGDAAAELAALREALLAGDAAAVRAFFEHAAVARALFTGGRQRP